MLNGVMISIDLNGLEHKNYYQCIFTLFFKFLDFANVVCWFSLNV